MGSTHAVLHIEKVELNLSTPSARSAWCSFRMRCEQKAFLTVSTLTLIFSEVEHNRLDNIARVLNHGRRQGEPKWRIESERGVCFPTLRKKLTLHEFEDDDITSQIRVTTEKLFERKIWSFGTGSPVSDFGDSDADPAHTVSEAEWHYYFALRLNIARKRYSPTQSSSPIPIQQLYPGLTNIVLWHPAQVYHCALTLASSAHYQKAEEIVNFAIMFLSPPLNLFEKLLLLRASLLLLQKKPDEEVSQWVYHCPEIEYSRDKIRVRTFYILAIATGNDAYYREAYALTANLQQRELALGINIELAIHVLELGAFSEDLFDLVRSKLLWCLTRPIQPETEVLCRLMLAAHPTSTSLDIFNQSYAAAQMLLTHLNPSPDLIRRCCDSYERAVFKLITRNDRELKGLGRHATFAIWQQGKLYEMSCQYRAAKQAYEVAIACYDYLAPIFPQSKSREELESDIGRMDHRLIFRKV